MSILAFDTSNYTTSVALLSQHSACSLTQLLAVPSSALGLRQQEALFQHVKVLPQLLAQLAPEPDFHALSAVAVATQPRRVEGSYMPCFLAGENVGKSLALALGLPCYSFAHQEGHIAAALWSLGQLDLLQGTFLSWHLSGGTTELLCVRPHAPSPTGFVVEKLGGTSDISAGQLIDRTGQMLGLDFPSGKAMDALALQSRGTLPPYPVKTSNLSCALSGMENKVAQFVAEGHPPQEICGFVFRTLAGVLGKLSDQAQQAHHLGDSPPLPLVFSGGVSASLFLRQQLPQGLFPEGKYATDNALGIGVLGERTQAVTSTAEKE